MVSGIVTSTRTGTTRGVVQGTTDAATTSSPSDAATSNAPSRVPAKTGMPRDRHSRTTSLPVLPEAPMTNTDASGGMAGNASSLTRPVWARGEKGWRARAARARGTRGTARVGDPGPAATRDVIVSGAGERVSRHRRKRASAEKARSRQSETCHHSRLRERCARPRARFRRTHQWTRQGTPFASTRDHHPPPASSAAARRHPAARGSRPPRLGFEAGFAPLPSRAAFV